MCFGVGVWLGASWFGGVSESVMFLSNSEFHEELYNCGVAGDSACFEEAYRDFAYHNAIHAGMLIDQDVFGMFTSELEAVLQWNNNIWQPR
ncbi:unnamed protein product [Scytosiphon promiscuus]